MEKIIKEMNLVEVEYNETKTKVTLTFFDEDLGEVREVHFNKQVYRDGGWHDDADKAARVEQTLYEYMGVGFDDVASVKDFQADVYCYDTFNSLRPVEQISKFTLDMKGEIYSTKIESVIDDDYQIKIRYQIDGKTYQTNMTHGKYIESLKKWAKDPQKREQKYKQFREKFGVDISKADSLIGRDIMVEVKSAFGTNLYGDIKKLKK